MDKQQLFTNMVTILNGKGRSVSPARHGACVYFLDDHPGCGIGCQPGFREKFGPDSDTYIGEGCPITDHLMRAVSVAEFFGIETPEDRVFLRDIQIYHDHECSWDENNPLFFDAERLKEFASEHCLEVPKLT